MDTEFLLLYYTNNKILYYNYILNYIILTYLGEEASFP